MKRTTLSALALACLTLFLSPAPVRAIPTGDTLLVTAYFSDASKTQLVGQKWSGCNSPSGSWGTTSPYFQIFFPPC